jgi:hypothetical protein
LCRDVKGRPLQEQIVGLPSQERFDLSPQFGVRSHQQRRSVLH